MLKYEVAFQDGDTTTVIADKVIVGDSGVLMFFDVSRGEGYDGREKNTLVRAYAHGEWLDCSLAE